MQVSAAYFDGRVAREHQVNLSLERGGLTFSGDELPPYVWNMSGLYAIDPPLRDHALRLSHDSQPGARLVINDNNFMHELLVLAPHLKGGLNPRRTLKFAMWTGLCLAAFAGVMYGVLNYAPQKIAVVLPDEWRERFGAQLEKALVDGAKACSTANGNSALTALIASLAGGEPDMPPITVKVYDIPIVNAFTLPGGHIVLTRGLLKESASADEVAGVVAHEIGHAAHRHPEAQMVRVMGVEILLSIASGTSGTNTGSLAGLAALMQSSREAERQADAYAVSMLSAAKINPMGLRNFFEKVLKEEQKPLSQAFSRIGSVFSTHPGTEDRIKFIKPMPADVPLKQSITNSQWSDLQKICG